MRMMRTEQGGITPAYMHVYIMPIFRYILNPIIARASRFTKTDNNILFIKVVSITYRYLS